MEAPFTMLTSQYYSEIALIARKTFQFIFKFTGLINNESEFRSTIEGVSSGTIL